MRNCGVIALVILLITSGLAGFGTSRYAPQPGFTFTADTTVIPAGGCVVLSWDEPLAIQLVLKGSNWPEAASERVGNTGTTTACPSAAARYVPDEPVIYTLTAFYADGSSQTRTITITYEGVAPTAPPPPFPVPTVFSPTPVPTPTRLAALYQPFEHGFMLHRVGENCIFAVASGGIVFDPSHQGDLAENYAYCIALEGLPELRDTDPLASGVFRNDLNIGRVWRAYPEVHEALGQPTGEAMLYTGSIPASPPAVSGAPFFTPIATLPDGRTLSCGTGSATAGSCVVE